MSIRPKRTAKPAPDSATDAAPYPGSWVAVDGSTAVVEVETAASDAAGAYPITPSTQMGEGWAAATADGTTNAHGRRLLFFEPEGEHAAAGVTAGMSMVGLRATNFSSGQGIAYMHESLYPAVGKRLTYVLNVAARAMTKQALNVHAGHDDYHAVDDTGFFQLFAKDVQHVADLTLIAHRIAELSLNPGLCAQDGFLTSHVIESARLPERELVRAYLGDPADQIPSPTPAQRLVFGDTRRRIPELFDLDYPAMLGVVQNQDSYAQGVAAQRPFYFDHLQELADRAMAEYAELTGRRYARAMGYRLEDAEYVLAGQGSVVSNAEAVADHLRATRGLKVGVLNLVMFRPFPADLVTALLGGRKAVVVLERVDQPLAVDPPLLREIRAAMGKAVENGRSPKRPPHPGLAALRAEQVPEFYAGGFGFGSRDLQPADLVAAVENMLPDGKQRRQFYLGIDFVRPDAREPKLQLWQQRVLDDYPHLADLSLQPKGDLDLMPEGSTSIRIHSVGGWGAITMGKNLCLTAFELFGLHVKANPKYGSEKKGQPTTFYATLAPEPIRLNAELRHVDVVLAPDPNVFRNSNPLAGLAEGGIFVLQSDQAPEEAWRALPPAAQRVIRDRRVAVYVLDAFKIATEESTEPDLRYRMQGAAFLGAFFAAAPLAERAGMDRDRVFAGLRDQMQKKFGKLGAAVVEANLRVIRRGYDELRAVPVGEPGDAAAGTAPVPRLPSLLDVPAALPGIGNPGRFWEQVCGYCALTGKDVIADPFAATSAIPAATSSVRDMTAIRFEVPDFVAERCTGCSQCWVQCPDAAIPGLVSTVEEVLQAGLKAAPRERSYDRLKQVLPHLARECRKLLTGTPFTGFGDVLARAYPSVAGKLGWDAERRAELDADFAALYGQLADFPLAKTTPFFDGPEAKEKGAGGLLSITVNPEACKGCNICVDVCPEQALVTVRQDDAIVDRLRRHWDLWEKLPDTPDRYLNIADLDEGIGVLSSLLLKKRNYRSMVGGDGACMGCGEKTAVHILVSTIEGVMQPRVGRFVQKIEGLVAGLEHQARELATAGPDVDPAALGDAAQVGITLAPAARERLEALGRSIRALRDLRWRYTEGPGGAGRAHMAMSNSTGCSSVWGSTYPYNPYPFPWVNHLFQDAPSVAIGIFEGHMRKMADAFRAVRRAERQLAGEWDPAADEPALAALDWKGFTEEEFDLCPPILAMGGDGAMLDIGFQNLSRLLASGKPLRVVVLDTQVYSNTGGQSCTSGFTGQVADMAAYGKVQHGKEETRKELGLIAMAHRGAYVLQTSQALPSHMMAGVIRGLRVRRPAVFNIYTPCPVEHGLPDEWAPHSAKLALESRAFPFLRFDPDAGATFAEALDLAGNPSPDQPWPTYDLDYVDEDGTAARLTLPLTIADWAVTESRFRKHFKTVDREMWTDAMLPFHELLALAPEEREGRVPFIHTVGADRRLERVAVSREIVILAEERQRHWQQLRELAGHAVAASVGDRIADEMAADFERRLEEMRSEYEAKLTDLRTRYPQAVARRLAEALLRVSDGNGLVADLLERAKSATPVGPVTLPPASAPAPAAPKPAAASEPAAEAPTAAPAAATAVAEEDEALGLEPYIDSALCTTCNECTNINSRLFAYNDQKQAYIKDPRAGTFAELVQAAERCPAGIIHPGTPLNPREKDLAKWVERAKRFN